MRTQEARLFESGIKAAESAIKHRSPIVMEADVSLL
jgi:hypothetical protein